jgi:hypothetical protein
MPLDEAYFIWLYSQVGEVDSKNLARSYWKLLTFLYEKEFTWKIAHDENRAIDGMNLRRAFLDQTATGRVDPAWMDEPCSMLEMMVALTWRMEWNSDEVSQATWFWILIDNLGLTECTDANSPDSLIIDSILDGVINREYGQNGAGGLFPLNNPKTDQREVELYYQAEAYLLERF